MPNYIDDNFITEPPVEDTEIQLPPPPSDESSQGEEEYTEGTGEEITFEPVDVSPPTTEYPFLIDFSHDNVDYNSYTVEAAQDAGIPDDVILAAAKMACYKLCKAAVYKHVVVYMPEWRQIKWRNFMTIYEKQQGGATLSDVETAIINQMCGKDNPTQSEIDEQYNNCLSALGWINNCILQCDNKETAVNAVTAVADLKSFTTDDMSFPAWPLS